MCNDMRIDVFGKWMFPKCFLFLLSFIRPINTNNTQTNTLFRPNHNANCAPRRCKKIKTICTQTRKECAELFVPVRDYVKPLHVPIAHSHQ